MNGWHIPIRLDGGNHNLIPPYSGRVVVIGRFLVLQVNTNGKWKKIQILKKRKEKNMYFTDFIVSDGINVRLFNPGKTFAIAYPIDPGQT